MFKNTQYLRLFLIGSLLLAAPCCMSIKRKPTMTEILVGELTRQQIEQSLPDWQKSPHELTNINASKALLEVPPGAELIIYLGTWCKDSKRELVRFWQALDALNIAPPLSIRYIGVDRHKLAPQVSKDLKLSYVPTFVLKREGKEIGRIVESAPRGIELEIKELLSGEKQGVISGRKDL